jgi:holo-[acyl-carrier protein] synthase
VRVFTNKEISYCRSKRKPSEHFAGKFAAKEAILKAMGGAGKKTDMKKIEILNTGKGAPRAKVSDKVLQNCRILLSISHSRESAVAFVIIAR